MKSHRIAAAVVATLIATPGFVAADTAANLQSQVISLLTSIVQLQKEVIEALTGEIAQLEKVSTGQQQALPAISPPSPLGPETLSDQAKSFTTTELSKSSVLTGAFSATPKSGQSPLTVNFDVQRPLLPDRTDSASYSVDFGDGSTGYMSISGDCRGFELNPQRCNIHWTTSHTYDTSSEYIATLRRHPVGEICENTEEDFCVVSSVTIETN